MGKQQQLLVSSNDNRAYKTNSRLKQSVKEPITGCSGFITIET